MKAITILQPFASLIADRQKVYETRGWSTSYRGPIAIHAGAKGMDIRDLSEPMIVAAQQAIGISNFDKLPHGCVIGIADLVDCLKVVGRASLRIGDEKQVVAVLENGVRIIGNELLFGDYTIGRYAWQLENVRSIVPVAARGMQRIWNWEGEYAYK